jgi:RNA polymerase sigma factor (TIGR02999 family)
MDLTWAAPYEPRSGGLSAAHPLIGVVNAQNSSRPVSTWPSASHIRAHARHPCDRLLGTLEPGPVTELLSLGVTRLLQRWGDGDRTAFDELVPIVYDALRRLAHERRRSERSDLSVNTTALVHEAYLKLVDLRQARFRDRAHFLAMASRVMRRLLVDHARARKAHKRGNDAVPLELEEALCASDENAAVLADLGDALERLEAVDFRASQVLEQHYFGGLTLEETAEALGVSLATVKRDLRFARAWLTADLSAGAVEAAGPGSG